MKIYPHKKEKHWDIVRDIFDVLNKKLDNNDPFEVLENVKSLLVLERYLMQIDKENKSCH